jgi:WD40 repeat protein
VAFSPDGKRLAACCYYDVVVWDLATGKEVFTLERCGDRVTFSPDGKLLATGSYTINTEGHTLGYVALWNAETGAKINSSEMLPGMLSRLAFSPDSTRIALALPVGGAACTVLVAEVNTLRGELFIAVESQRISGLAFSPDGWRLYGDAGGYGTPAELRAWDSRSGDARLRLLGHEDPVFGLALSADGKRLASVSADRTLRLWDTASGIELFSLRLASADWECLAFSPDGRRLAAAGKGDAILLWEAAPR